MKRRPDLIGFGEPRSYGAGHLVVEEGTNSDCLFILEEGAVRVEKQDGGNSVLLAVLNQPGDFFGEMTMILNISRSLSIRLREADERILQLARSGPK